MRPFMFLGLFAAAVLAASSAYAQLLTDDVEGDRRVCNYVGSDQLPDGQVAQRIVVLPSAQPCPAAAPYRDPNRPIPGNAMLTGEVVVGGRRQCNYSQGGVDYDRSVALSQACAQTPDLLDRATLDAAAGRR